MYKSEEILSIDQNTPLTEHYKNGNGELAPNIIK